MAKSTTPPTEKTPRAKKPDEIQREFWQYRRLWITILVLLIAGRLILPHTPLLRGWEQKFANNAVEMGKTELPSDAVRTAEIQSINMSFKPPLQIPEGFGEMVGPHLIGGWKCEVLKTEGLCVRYVWNHEPLTLVLMYHPPRGSEKRGPFVRTGWAGYYIVKSNFAAAVTGPFSLDDIRSAWSAAR